MKMKRMLKMKVFLLKGFLSQVSKKIELTNVIFIWLISILGELFEIVIKLFKYPYIWSVSISLNRQLVL